MKNNRFFLIACVLGACGLCGCMEETTRNGSAEIICGDGSLGMGEVCDDGNTISGDGCSSDCNAIEDDYECKTPGQLCTKKEKVDDSVCGDGKVEGSEVCDDSNAESGDGCSADCMTVESNYDCPAAGGKCTEKAKVACGNGIVEAGEECDYDLFKGTPMNEDGCDTTCHIEPGFSCDTESCWPHQCGNGYKEGNEECDSFTTVEYGLLTDGARGCTVDCKYAPFCGDAKVQGDHDEECDLGSNNGSALYGNGCSADCKKLPYCGDGVFTHDLNGTVYEECDPSLPGYKGGCNDDCTVKDGWICSAKSGLCVEAGSSVDEEGNYVARCNNGIVDQNEECDDTSKPGCNSDCTAASGYKCVGSGMKCTTDCTSAAKECVPIGYGDGKIDKDGYEQCDDGNVKDGDGCSSKGLVEPGYRCPTPGEACVALKCGDGIRAYGEECDDGNANDGDGCNARCRIEDGGACSRNDLGGKSICAPGSCGDGKIQKNEQCEPKNNSNCSEFCKIITRDLSKCGDGVVDKSAGEECDDHNKIGGDGCSPSCKIESAFECFDDGRETVCKPICGDGITMWMLGEQCDDHNNESGDGCSADCKIEYGYSCTDFKNNPYPEHIDLPVTFRDFIGYDQTGNGEGYMSSEYLKELKSKDSTCGRTVASTNGVKRSAVEAGHGHPDFQYLGGHLCKGLVKDELNGAGKPVFSFNYNDASWVESECASWIHEADKNYGNHVLCAASFDTWYKDDSRINKSLSGTIPMLRTDPKKGEYVFDSQKPPAVKNMGGVYYNKMPAYFSPLTNAGFKDHRTIPNEVSYKKSATQTDTYHQYGVFCYNSLDDIVDCTGTYCYNPTEKKYQECTNAGTENSEAAAMQDYYKQYFTDQGISTNNGEYISKQSDGYYKKEQRITYSQSYGNHPTVPYQVNGAFTTEIHTYFQYKPEKAGDVSKLNFTGDDDVWVYINNKLFVDIGGMHGRLKGENQLEAETCGTLLCDTKFEVYEGGVYDMHIFQAERNYTASNFKLTLTGFINTGVSVCETKCGNGQVSPDEECDEGFGAEALFKGCSSDCKKVAKCGNGIVEGDEQCDNGFLCDKEENLLLCADIRTKYDPNMACDNNCRYTQAVCGNNVREGAEECDGTDTAPGKSCNNKCRFRACGDGIVDRDQGEECDNGRNNGLGNCSKGCTISRCGDGIVDEFNGEACDDGKNTGKYGSCAPDCSYVAPKCGDGIIQADANGVMEECDNGAANSDDAYGLTGCTTQCKRAPYCGDGHTDSNFGEECDGGSGCTTQCTPKVN